MLRPLSRRWVPQHGCLLAPVPFFLFRTFLRRLDDVDPFPLFAEHMLVEELKAVAIQLDRAPRVGLQQGRNKALQVRSVERIGTTVVKSRDTAHRAGVGFDRLGAFPLQRIFPNLRDRKTLLSD